MAGDLAIFRKSLPESFGIQEASALKKVATISDHRAGNPLSLPGFLEGRTVKL
jgi:hypothetical protein